MSIKERINQMLEQYSMTKDNPTVLRALQRLSAVVDVVIAWIEDNDPQDFHEQLDAINARLDEIEAEIQNFNLETINQMIDDMQTQIDGLSVEAEQAMTAANAASAKADAAKTAANNADAKASAAKASVEEVDTRLTAEIETVDGKADAAKTTAEGAAKKAGSAQTTAAAADNKANQAIEAANRALIKSDEAIAAAGSAMERAVEANTALESKQDKLTFDTRPTEGSSNPVTSGGVYTAIRGIVPPSVVLDDTVTEDSQKGVKSSGIYTYGQGIKTEALTAVNNVDVKATANASAIAGLQEFQDTQEETNTTHNTQIAQNTTDIQNLKTGKQNQIKKGDENIVPVMVDVNASDRFGQIPDAFSVLVGLNRKQERLTFDTVPTEGSNNPVTSGGIYAAIADSIPSIVVDNVVTPNSQNPVTSAGIYNAIAVKNKRLTFTVSDTGLANVDYDSKRTLFIRATYDVSFDGITLRPAYSCTFLIYPNVTQVETPIIISLTVSGKDIILVGSTKYIYISDGQMVNSFVVMLKDITGNKTETVNAAFTLRSGIGLTATVFN